MDRVEFDLEKVSNGAKVVEPAVVQANNTQVKTAQSTKSDVVNNLTTEDDESCLAANSSMDLPDEKSVLAKAVAAEKTSNTSKTSGVTSVSALKYSSAYKAANTKLTADIASINDSITSLDNKIKYLKNQIETITKKLETAKKNNNEYQQYVYEQQLAGCNSQISSFELQKTIYGNIQAKLKEYSASLNKYSNNSEVANIISQKADLVMKQKDIAQRKTAAVQTEDEYAQYQIEQEENKINSQLKTLEIDQLKAEATADGRVVSAQEINLYSAKLDINFRQERIVEKSAILQQKLIDIAAQKLTAVRNGDEYAQYVLEQQESSINSLLKTFEIEKANMEKQAQSVETSLGAIQKYASTTIQGYSSEMAELNEQLAELGKQKATAMQNEDEYAQYEIELKENEIHEKLKKLEVKQAKAIAKEEGRTISDTEVKFIEYLSDAKFRLSRISEKRQYLSYKSVSIAQAKSSAMQNGDEYSQYVLEQQENSINALDKIFEMDQINLEKSIEKLSQSLELMQKYPNNKNIANILEQQYQLVLDSYDIASKKSMAMQKEDGNEMAEIIAKENTINSKDKDLEVKLQQLIAKAEGRTLSLSEITKIKSDIDNGFNTQKVEEIRQYINYKLIAIAQQKSTAMQNKDEYAQYVLEQQENALNALYKLSDSELLSKYPDVSYVMKSVQTDGIIKLDPREWDGTFDDGEIKLDPREWDGTFDDDGQVKLDPREWDGTFDDETPDNINPQLANTTQTHKFDDGSYEKLTYDEHGWCVKSVYYDKKGKIQSTERYEYDKKGNCISSKSYDADDKLCFTTKSTYDEKGNQLTHKSYDADGTLNVDDSCIYDSDGNLVQDKYLSYDADGSYCKRINSYDNNENITDILIAYDKNGSVNYAVYDNYKGNYPCVNCWSTDSAQLYFSDNKYITIKKGDSVNINSDGSVVVISKKGTVKYNKNGKKIS